MIYFIFGTILLIIFLVKILIDKQFIWLLILFPILSHFLLTKSSFFNFINHTYMGWVILFLYIITFLFLMLHDVYKRNPNK
ncbi:hypothetical protein COE67_10795 [Priestia megaterium]|nr:hypothetical protein COE67_10795 [Priestia megaterium]